MKNVFKKLGPCGKILAIAVTAVAGISYQAYNAISRLQGEARTFSVQLDSLQQRYDLARISLREERHRINRSILDVDSALAIRTETTIENTLVLYDLMSEMEAHADSVALLIREMDK